MVEMRNGDIDGRMTEREQKKLRHSHSPPFTHIVCFFMLFSQALFIAGERQTLKWTFPKKKYQSCTKEKTGSSTPFFLVVLSIPRPRTILDWEWTTIVIFLSRGSHFHCSFRPLRNMILAKQRAGSICHHHFFSFCAVQQKFQKEQDNLAHAKK